MSWERQPQLAPSRLQLLHGRDEPPAERRELRAGRLVVELEGIDLRYARLATGEILRRLYAAVRDHEWNTIPGTVSNLEVDARDDSFTVTFDVEHCQGDVDFRWHGTLAGGPEPRLECSLAGVAGRDFRYNRIGFCLHHPPQLAGRPFRARTPDGELRGELPELIGLQRIENGTIHPLFPSFDELEIELPGGLRVRFQFEGDLFEMEDHRNWTDANFKTYSTPLSLPWPHDARAGQRIEQRVTLTLEGAARGRIVVPGERPRIALGEPLGARLPPIGLGMASHGTPLSDREAALLGAMRLAHLRADLHLGTDFEGTLERALDEAAVLGMGLELAVFLDENPESELEALAGVLDSPRVVRVLVVRKGEAVTAARWVRLARERLSSTLPNALFAGGTDIWFTDLNRGRPELDAMDAVFYSINPQVHAFDEASLVENAAAQADTVRSARAFCGDLPIFVTPVTLRPRFNPHAKGPEPEPGPGELPSQIDPRQAALFGAVWTLGSVKYLGEPGAAGVTYYETTGWRGVIEIESGSPVPERFPSRPGMVFPLYHVLADVGEWQGAELVAARSTQPLAVDALAVRGVGALHLLLANMTPTEQRCSLGALPADRVSLRRLDEETASVALDEPDRFRADAETQTVDRGELELELAPYAVVRIDTAG